MESHRQEGITRGSAHFIIGNVFVRVTGDGEEVQDMIKVVCLREGWGKGGREVKLLGSKRDRGNDVRGATGRFKREMEMQVAVT